MKISKECDTVHSSDSREENGTVSSVPNSPIVSNIHPSCLPVVISVSNKFED